MRRALEAMSAAHVSALKQASDGRDWPGLTDETTAMTAARSAA